MDFRLMTRRPNFKLRPPNTIIPRLVCWVGLLEVKKSGERLVRKLFRSAVLVLARESLNRLFFVFVRSSRLIYRLKVTLWPT